MKASRLPLALFFVVALGGCAVGEFLAGAPPKRERGAPAGILARRCSSCHVVPNPASMGAAEWRGALVRMQRRMQLPPSEWDSLASLARP